MTEPDRWWALMGFFAVGLFLRLHGLGTADFNLDEVDLWGYILGVSAADHQEPPLPALLMRFWFEVRPADGNVNARLPSAIAGALTVPATFVLGRVLAGSRCGLYAAAILALHPFAVAWSQRMRPYGLLSLVTVLIVVALIEALRKGGAWRFVVLAALLMVGLTTHLLTVFIAAAIALDAMLRVVGAGTGLALAPGWRARARAEAPLVASLAVASLGLAWTVSRVHVTSALDFTEADSALVVLGDIARILMGTLGLEPTALWILVTLAALAAALLGARGFLTSADESEGRILVLITLVVTVAVTLTLGGKEPYGAANWSRYVSNTIPLVAILSAAGLARIVPSGRGEVAIWLWILVTSAPGLALLSEQTGSEQNLARSARAVAKTRAELQGLLVVGQEPWWVERTAINYFRIRQDDLPGFSLQYGGKVLSIDSRTHGGVPSFRLVEPFGAEVRPPSSGTYAVLRDTSEACDALPGRVGWAVSESRSGVRGGGQATGPVWLLFCDIRFR